MKIKYTVYKEILSTDITLKKLETKIVHELTLLKANNIRIEGNIVSFENETFEWRTNFSLMSQLTSGYFETLLEDDKFKIHFVGYYSLYNEALIFFISLPLAFIIHYGFFMGCIFSIVSYLGKYLIVSNESDFLMTKI